MASTAPISDSQIPSVRSPSDTLSGSSPEPGKTSQFLLQCLVALVVVAVALGVLCSYGLVNLSGEFGPRACEGRPASSSDYSLAWQSARTVLSLLVGVLLTSCGEGTFKRAQGDATSSSSCGRGFTTMVVGMVF